MKTKYAVLNPLTSEYIYTTMDELPSLVAKTAMDFYLSHVHNTLYAEIQLNIDGTETWKSPQGTEMIEVLAKQQLESETIAVMETTVL